jgi:hypothetical protein
METGRAVEIDHHVTRGIHETEEIGTTKPTPSLRGDNPKGILKKTLKQEIKTPIKTNVIRISPR